MHFSTVKPGPATGHLSRPPPPRATTTERPPQQGQELSALTGRETTEHLVFNFDGHLSSPLQGPAPLGCDRDLAGPTVAWRRAAPGKPGGFELVDERDDRARVDAHRRADLLLDCSFACAEDVEQGKQRRRQADRLERLRDARMRGAPEPEEQLSGELGDLEVGGGFHGHSVIFSTLVGRPQ
jgi:hypothetical protein